jgi:hypothetical protein
MSEYRFGDDLGDLILNFLTRDPENFDSKRDMLEYTADQIPNQNLFERRSKFKNENQIRFIRNPYKINFEVVESRNSDIPQVRVEKWTESAENIYNEIKENIINNPGVWEDYYEMNVEEIYDRSMEISDSEEQFKEKYGGMEVRSIDPESDILWGPLPKRKEYFGRDAISITGCSESNSRFENLEEVLKII